MFIMFINVHCNSKVMEMVELTECEYTIMSREDFRRSEELLSFGNHIKNDPSINQTDMFNKSSTMADLSENIIIIRNSYGLPSNGQCKDCLGDRCAMGIHYKPIKEPVGVWFVGVLGKNGRVIKKRTETGTFIYEMKKIDELCKKNKNNKIFGMKPSHSDIERLLRYAPLGTIVQDFDKFLNELRKD